MADIEICLDIPNKSKMKTEKRKLLFLFSGLSDVGGIQRYGRNLLDAVLEMDCDIRAISRNDVEKRYKNFLITSFGHYKSVLLRKLAFSVEILMEILVYNPDLIVCAHINFSSLCLLAKKIFRKDYIVICYGIDAYNISIVKRTALLNAKACVVISNYTKEVVSRQLSHLKDKIYIIPPSVDAKAFSFFPKPQFLTQKYKLDGKKVVLTVCRLMKQETYKGFYKILDTLTFVRRQIPDVKYILIGYGDAFEDVKEYIIDKGIEENVILTGYVPDEQLLYYYNMCDVFVMPSAEEGFGIVFLEALACGKPVIAGNKDGSRDALLGGEIGVLVDPEEVNQISDAIIKILKREVPHRLLDGDYLRKSVLEHYGQDKFKNRFKTLLISLNQ